METVHHTTTHRPSKGIPDLKNLDNEGFPIKEKQPPLPDDSRICLRARVHLFTSPEDPDKKGMALDMFTPEPGLDPTEVFNACVTVIGGVLGMLLASEASGGSTEEEKNDALELCLQEAMKVARGREHKIGILDHNGKVRQDNAP